MGYVSQLTEESIIRLHEKVTELKTWRKLEARYMTVEEWMKDREARVREETEQEVKQEAVFDLLEEYGTIPEHIREVVLAQKDLTVLKRWLKLAARAGSMEQFEKEM